MARTKTIAKSKSKPARKAPAKAPSNDLQIKRSVLRVLILTFISFGFYSLYWFYVTRQQLNEALGDRVSLSGVSPLLQAIGPMLLFILAVPLLFILIGFLLIPVAIVFSIVVWYYLIKDINQARESVRLEATPPVLYILGYVVLSFMSPFNLGVIGLLAYQLNEAWDKQTKGKATEAPYTPGEIIVSAAGIALFLVIFFAIFVIAILGAATQQ